MSTAERIQKFGFKRWYERTLLESHAYLVTAFLGMIVTFAGIELVGERSGASRLFLGLAASGTGIALVALGLHRYYRILLRAESFGDSATCAHCSAYASFNVLASGNSSESVDGDTAWLKVRCRRCGNEWTMSPSYL